MLFARKKTAAVALSIAMLAVVIGFQNCQQHVFSPPGNFSPQAVPLSPPSTLPQPSSQSSPAFGVDTSKADFQLFGENDFIVAQIMPNGSIALCNAAHCATALTAPQISDDHAATRVKFSLNGNYLAVRLNPNLNNQDMDVSTAYFASYKVDQNNLTLSPVNSTGLLGSPEGCNFNFDISNQGIMAIAVGNSDNSSHLLLVGPNSQQDIGQNSLNMSLQYTYLINFNSAGDLALTVLARYLRRLKVSNGSYQWLDSNWIEAARGYPGPSILNLLFDSDDQVTLTLALQNNNRTTLYTEQIAGSADASPTDYQEISGSYADNLIPLGTPTGYLRQAAILTRINGHLVMAFGNWQGTLEQATVENAGATIPIVVPGGDSPYPPSVIWKNGYVLTDRSLPIPTKVQ